MPAQRTQHREVPRRTAGWSLAALLLVSGCKVDSGDVDEWKSTVKGPPKIVAVMLADKYDAELRSHAALALVQMERQDVDGLVKLQEGLQRLDDAERSQIVADMVPGLVELMKTRNETGEGPAPVSIRAKDAAFVIARHAPEEAKKQLTQAVIGWYVEDFNGRSLAGNFSAEQVIRELGSPAATALVTGLNAKVPQQALVKVAELIGQIGDDAGKQAAGKRLVEIEQEMNSPAFLAWLKTQVKGQMEKDGKKLPEAQLNRIAELNRDNFIDQGVLPGMKHLADVPAVTQRLMAMASDKKLLEERRARALMALESKVGEAQLSPLLALALDGSSPPSVRDYAFDRVGDVRSARSLPQLWSLVGEGTDPRVRWRAADLVLAIGGNEVVTQWFSKLPSGSPYAAEEIDGYANRLAQMKPPPIDLMRSHLSSKRWQDRVIALKFLERKGDASDLPRIKALQGDSEKVNGPRWTKDLTVGGVAKASYRAAEDRIKSETEGSKT